MDTIIGKNVSSKKRQKCFDCVKKSATKAYKTTSEITLQKIADHNIYLICNNMINITTKV